MKPIICMSVVIALLLSAATASAQLNCDVVERLGESLAPAIIAEVNAADPAERTQRISRRKTLTIDLLDSITFSGCTATIRANLTMKRKIRRDASGSVVLRAEITSFNLPRREVCFKDPKVQSLNLSKTTKLGEKVYGWIGKLALRRHSCFSVQ